MISKKPVNAEDARHRMAALCARSEQAPADIRLKLFKLRISRREAEEIIQWLSDNKFLDAPRYARAYTADKVRFSCWGSRKIRAGLYAKRIDSDIIDEAIAGIDPNDYRKALSRALKSAMRNCNPSIRSDKEKIIRRLAARGFEPSLIFKAIDKATALNDEISEVDS